MKEILKDIDEELGLGFTLLVLIAGILVVYDWYTRLEGLLK